MSAALIVLAWLLVGFAAYVIDCRWDVGNGIDKRGSLGGLFIVMGPLFMAAALVMGAFYLLGKLANRLVSCGDGE